MNKKKKDEAIQAVNAQVIESLERGVVPWLNPFKSHMSIYGHVYRGINRLVLNLVAQLEGYQSPYWMTYNAIKKREGNVNKGEKSTTIVYNGYRKFENEDGEESYYRVFNSWQVFNKDQCVFDDEYFMEWAENGVSEAPPEAHKLIADYLVREDIELTHTNGYAGYSPKKDRINCPKPESLTDPELYVPTLFHEMGHSTGHESRLNREGIRDRAMFASHEYSKEELVAEMTCAYLCGYMNLGMDHIEQSASYLEGWLKKLKEDGDILQQACTEAESSFQYILTGEIDEDLKERE